MQLFTVIHSYVLPTLVNFNTIAQRNDPPLLTGDALKTLGHIHEQILMAQF